MLLVTSNSLSNIFFWMGRIGVSSYLLIDYWLGRLQANKSFNQGVSFHRVSERFFLSR
jgi:NADH:ubiquinone oxidoreductase subunit 5 (subunit L)/multisubunit Na+/H+ antiporter MnhA subunit